MTEKQKLVVIGNGMAGARFVEETVAMGGRDLYDITVIGEETCGNYNRILLSSVLSGSHRPDDIFINPLDWYEENGVELHAGVRVIGVDRKGKMAYGQGGVLIPYDKLVIATGSSAFVPPMEGLYEEDGSYKAGAFVFRTLEDCTEIIEYAGDAKRAAVIGGGLLGLEAAKGLMNRGLQVDVIHLMGWLMETQLDPMSGRFLQQSLEELGVQFHLEKLTTAVLGDEKVTGLQFKDGEHAGLRHGRCFRRRPAQRGPGAHGRAARAAGHPGERQHVLPERPGHLRHRRVRGASQPGLRVGRSALGAGSRAGRAS